MQRIDLKRNWGILPITAAFLAPLYYGVWVMTFQMIESTRAGRALPQGSTWWQLASVYVLVIAGTIYIFYRQLAEILTVMTVEGIRKPTWRGPIFLPWSEVSRVVFVGHAVELHSPDTTIKIYLGTFGDSVQILSEIRNRVPKSAFKEYEDSGTISTPFTEI